MRRVIQFGDSFLPVTDGVTIVMMNYAKWITKKYGKCDVIVPHCKETLPDNYEYDVYRFKSIDSVIKRPYRIGVPGIDRTFMLKIHTLDADIVHAHSPYVAGGLAYKFAKSKNIPLVSTFHTKFYEDFYACTHSRALSKYAVKLAVKFFEKSDYVWAVSKSAKETLRSYGYKGDIEIMPNGCDTISSLVDQKALLEKINKRYDISDVDPIFIFVGRLDWHKNIRLILNAAKIFFSDHPGKLLMIGGDGMHDLEIKHYVKRHGLSARVIFAGKILDRDELFMMYKRAHLLLFPSTYDTLSLVVREAASVGCPSILVRGSGANEGCVENEDVFLCENSAMSLAKKMRESLEDKERYAKIKSQCNRIAVPWENIVDRVAKRYDEIIANWHKNKMLCM